VPGVRSRSPRHAGEDGAERRGDRLGLVARDVRPAVSGGHLGRARPQGRLRALQLARVNAGLGDGRGRPVARPPQSGRGGDDGNGEAPRGAQGAVLRVAHRGVEVLGRRRGEGGPQDGLPRRGREHLSQQLRLAVDGGGYQDEAGPYQAIPHPGAACAPAGRPPRQPHEYVRGGTAKLLTLFRPATGVVRAKGVTRAPNAVLHPWLWGELTQILAALPPAPPPAPTAPFLPVWWRRRQELPHFGDPPLRLILIWDNLVGHHRADLVRWLRGQGILPLYTPLSGSWLNLADALPGYRCLAVGLSASDGLARVVPRPVSGSGRRWPRPWG
jgi:hypothetical protein